MAFCQCRPCQPRAVKGDVSHRALPHSRARRPCRALRGLLAHPHRLQLLPQPALPQVPGRCSPRVARRARDRAVAGAVLPRRIHVARRAPQHRLSEQSRSLRSTVQSVGRDPDHDCDRSQASGRPHRLYLGAAYLGLYAYPPSACAHDRAGWRLCAGRLEVDPLPTALLLDGEGPLGALPPTVPADAACRARGRTAAVLRRFCSACQQTCFRSLSKTAGEEKVGGLLQKTVRRSQASLALSVALHHRVAISNRRLISAENGVTFRYKDYRLDGSARYKRMTLATNEFIRRFLIHILPKGFHRIRHYGLLAKANCAANIARARQLLAAPSSAKESQPSAATATDEQRILPCPCPCCGGRMIIIESFA